MKQELAVALALAIAGLGVGLAPVPQVAAGHQDCHEDFKIADSEAAADNRPLDAQETEIGLEGVMSGTGETLHVALRSPADELEFKVFELDGSNCTNVTDDVCDSDPVVLDQFDEEATCDLAAPSGLDYFVHVTNTQLLDSLLYEIWSVT